MAGATNGELRATGRGGGSAAPRPVAVLPPRGSRRVGGREPGLSLPSAIALALGAGVGGGAVDIITGSGLRVAFAVSFVAGCVAAASLVRRSKLAAAVVMPPLLYVVLALAAAVTQTTDAAGPLLTRQLLELVTSMLMGAPVLVAATGAAGVVAAVRVLAGMTRDRDLGTAPHTG